MTELSPTPRDLRSRRWRRAGWFGALALLVIATAWTSRAREGARMLAASDAAFARGDRVEAIVLARAAAEARCPACSAPERAEGRLEAIAKDAEARGDDQAAVAAWRAARTAALGTALLDTTSARRVRADAEIARLEHRIDIASAAATGTNGSPAATEDRLRAALASTALPSGLVFLLLTVGAAIFLAGAVRFVRASGFRPAELALAGAGIAVIAASVLLF